MGRFELEPKLKEEIRARVLGEGFMKIVQTVRRNGKQFKIAMRPVEIGGEKKFQAEMTDDGQVQVKNLDMNAGFPAAMTDMVFLLKLLMIFTADMEL